LVTGYDIDLSETYQVQPSGNAELVAGGCCNPVERTGDAMTSDTTVLMTDMAILVGIFLLGLLAKLFPRNGRKAKE
jgi:hypothetical protein